MGSSRFPGKMLSSLGSYPIIQWVLTRLLDSRQIDETILATSVGSENNPLEDCAGRLGISTYRGDETDVLGRYTAAARSANATHVVRVCGDNPFVASEEIDRLITFYGDARPDYAFNHIPRMHNNYPDGLGAEILSRAVLERLDACAREQRHREHVTLYIWDNPGEFRISSLSAPAHIAFPNIKLDIDTAEDLERLQKLSCVGDIHASAQSVVEAYRRQYGV